MATARLPEQQRLAALAKYDVLDTPADPAFDDLARLAARLCDVPIALVSLVDRDRQWFKSCVGLPVRQTPRGVAFCAHAIESDQPFIIPDAHADARFRDNPLVTGPPGIRFYAGFPLIDDEGAALGTLCVIDVRPRTLSDGETETLRVLARQVVAQLRLRLVSAALRVQLAEVELAHRRASFLSDAGKLLAGSLDIEITLDAVARLAVPSVADLCSIMVVEADGSFRRVAEAGLEVEGERQMRSLRERGPATDAPLAMRHALEQRRPVLFADYKRWLRERLPPDHPYRATMDTLDVVSGISAPMTVGGRVLGVLNVGTQRVSGRSYGEPDLITMGELAQRAALALENARLFEQSAHERGRAEEASRTKDAFLAAVSHDLRTPLNAILGWTQMLRDRQDQPELRGRAIDVIERNARAQSQLIEDLLDVSRIAAAQLRVAREPVDLVEVVDGALETLRPSAEARGIAIRAALAAEARAGIGDFGRLQQVVWNLVSNAIKFSRPGGRVDVTLERAGTQQARLTVRDEGRGIPSELLPQIFEPFRQDIGGVGRRLGGLGLGLSIARHIVEAVGGTITAHSAGEGQGASLVVLLPLAGDRSA